MNGTFLGEAFKGVDIGLKNSHGKATQLIEAITDEN